MTENYRERWEKLGLIAGLDNDVADKVAIGFEEMANDMLTCEPYIKNYSWDSFGVIAFPMLRRIITECPDFTYAKFKEFFEGRDLEATMVATISDYIIAKEKDRVKEDSK